MQPHAIAESVEQGHLYVVATPIGNLGDLSPRAAHILKNCDLIACEDTRVTQKLLHHLGLDKKMIPYHDVNEKEKALELVNDLASGKSIALVSDAGTPTLSDPGFRLVRECRLKKIPVIPIPGPTAFLAALSASGLPTNGFFFIGFLPPKSAARKRFFEKNKTFEYTLALYESSHRIDKLMIDLLETLGPDRTICLAREITKRYETFLVGPAHEVNEAFNNHSKKGEFVVLIAPHNFSL